MGFMPRAGQSLYLIVIEEIRGSVAIIRDITQDKIAAAQLEQTITELQNQVQLTDTIFSSISDGVVVTG